MSTNPASPQQPPLSRRTPTSASGSLAAGSDFDYSQTTFQGPIPPPDLMAEYSAIDPNLPDRLMSLAEDQVRRNFDLQHYQLETARESVNVARETVQLEYHDRRRGQILAFLVFLLSLASTIYLVTNHQPLAGSIIGGLFTLGIIAAYIRGRRAADPR